MKKAEKIYLFTNSETCQPCKNLEKLIKDVNFDLPITKIFLGFPREPETIALVNKYEIRSIPTLVFVDVNEDIVHKMSGGYPNAVSLIKDAITKLK